MNAKKMVVFVLAAVALAVFVGRADAALLAPYVDNVSGELAAFDRFASHTTDGSGLTGTGAAGSTHADGENGIAWTTPGNLGGGYGTDFDPEITYDLGHLVNLTTMRIWNYNSSFITGGSPIAIVGPNQVEVFTSPDGATFSSQGMVNFAQAPGANGYTGQDIAVNYPNTRFVKFDVQTNHDGAVFDGTGTQGGTIDGRSLTGLSEVRFEGGPVDDALTVRPFVVQVSSQNPVGIDRLAAHTVDGRGMSGIGKPGDTHINVADPGYVWTTVGNIGPGTDFDPFITYDLGGLVDVKTMRIWNDNSAPFTHLGTKDVEVFAGPTLASMTSRGTVTLARASGLPTYHGQDYAVDYEGVRYIQFDVQSNLDGAVFDGTGAQGGADGRHLTGLSEVRFDGKPVGEVIVAPWVAQVSSQLAFIDRAAVHTVDGSGLSGIGEAGDTHVSAADPGYMWTSDGVYETTDYDPYITYDLGGVVNVETMRIWNYNEAGFSEFGPKDVEVFAGPTLASMTSRGLFDLLQATELGTYTGEDIDVSFVGVRYVMFDILSNFDGAVFDGTGQIPGADGRSLTGLSEVRFVVTAVPEPGTLALLGLGGLALFGLAIFRRCRVPKG